MKYCIVTIFIVLSSICLAQDKIPYYIYSKEVKNDGTAVWTITNKPFLNEKERKPASVKIETDLPQKIYFYPWKIGTEYGNVKITNTQSDMSFSFTKVKGSYSFFKNDYLISFGGGINKFGSIEHSMAQEPVEPKGLYGEGFASIGMKYGNVTPFIKYDVLNYFTMNNMNEVGFELTPEIIHRVNIGTGYQFSNSFSAFASIGYIPNLSKSQITGFDGALGITYTIDKKQKYKITHVIYNSQFSTENSNNESSQATLINFSIGF